MKNAVFHKLTFILEQCHSVTYGKCFEIWKSTISNKIIALSNFIEQELNFTDTPNWVKESIDKISKFVHCKIKGKYESCNRSFDRVYEQHAIFLATKITINERVIAYINLSQAGPSNVTLKKGRPLKDFTQCTQKSKRRRVADLLKTRSGEELQFAAQISNRLTHQNKSFSMIEALALCLDLKLSVRQYKLLRRKMNSLHPETFPSYLKIKKYKESLLPSEYTITEISAEIKMQELLNQTASSILELVPHKNFKSVTLLVKCGFDGSSGHSRYKQKFTDPSLTDEFMFFEAMVPIHMEDNDKKCIIWKNETPSSTLLCRPLKFLFTKESPALVEQEYDNFKKAVLDLTPTTIGENDAIVIVVFDVRFTMIDGSICNIISKTNSTQVCYICGSKPSEMNTAAVFNKTPNEGMYQYGLSSLHLWIRCFENILHIAYRLPFKKWQARGEENKKLFAENKKQIQDQFRDRMGLLVDMPKVGFGNTNDGNTARRFFKDPTSSSNITGVNYELIYNLGIILRVISAGQKINIIELQTLIDETRRIYVTNYLWYNMSVTMHKLLIHGIDIISNMLVPIGQLSEEALEARHKEIRYLREHHTRKNSRINTNKDLFQVLLINSDPHVSKYRANHIKLKKKKDSDIIKYLIDDSNYCESSDTNRDTCSESDSDLI